jgi:hypothetical protein
MKNIVIDNCPACEPINRLIGDLENNGVLIIESKLEDYHFHQMYFKINASLEQLKDMNLSGFTKNDNFLICDCHWSRIEFNNNQN